VVSAVIIILIIGYVCYIRKNYKLKEENYMEMEWIVKKMKIDKYYSNN